MSASRARSPGWPRRAAAAKPTPMSRRRGKRTRGRSPARDDVCGLRHLLVIAAGWCFSACRIRRTPRRLRQAARHRPRPDIVDRNGESAGDRHQDGVAVCRAAQHRRSPTRRPRLLATVLPDLDYEQTYDKLKSGAGFVWLKRAVVARSSRATSCSSAFPASASAPRTRRFYPGGPTASHIVGLVNIDNQGIAGMEKYIDGSA